MGNSIIWTIKINPPIHKLLVIAPTFTPLFTYLDIIPFPLLLVIHPHTIK